MPHILWFCRCRSELTDILIIVASLLKNFQVNVGIAPNLLRIFTNLRGNSLKIMTWLLYGSKWLRTSKLFGKERKLDFLFSFTCEAIHSLLDKTWGYICVRENVPGGGFLVGFQREALQAPEVRAIAVSGQSSRTWAAVTLLLQSSFQDSQWLSTSTANAGPRSLRAWSACVTFRDTTETAQVSLCCAWVQIVPEALMTQVTLLHIPPPSLMCWSLGQRFLCGELQPLGAWALQ